MKTILLDNNLIKVVKSDKIIFEATLLFQLNVMDDNDVFTYIEKNILKDSNNFNNYAKKRLDALKGVAKYQEEVTIDRIYDNFVNDTILKSELINIEISSILDFVTKDKIVYNFINSFNGQISIINDTIYSDEILYNILTKVGYKSKFPIIGDLKEIESDTLVFLEKNSAKKIDNAIILKRNNFISKKEYKKLVKRARLDSLSQLNFSIICGFINNNINVNENYFYNIGFSKFGILLFAFCYYLINNIDDDINKIYFLARDGYIIEKAFNIINDTNKFKTHYMYVSRISLRSTIYVDLSTEEEIYNTCSISKIDTYASILKRLGLNTKQINQIISMYGDKLVCKNKDEFIDIIKQNKDNIICTSKGIKKSLKKYLNDIEFNNKVAVVDIGFHGTIQYELLNIIKDIDIVGYYLNIVDNKYPNIKKKYFIKEMNFFETYVGPIELFFSSLEGTTLTYKNNNYILDNYEFSNDQKEKILTMHQGGLDFVQEFNLFTKNLNINISSSEAYLLLKQLLLSPGYQDIKEYQQLYYSDNGVVSLLIPNKSNFYYIFHLKELINLYIFSPWKMAYYKKLGFSYPINLYIYKLIQKLKNK